MDQPRIAQQTSTTLPLAGTRVRDAPQPQPKSLLDGTFDGRLQWALRSGLERAAPDRRLRVAVRGGGHGAGGVQATTSVSAMQAPLLALPVLAMLLLYCAGCIARVCVCTCSTGSCP